MRLNINKAETAINGEQRTKSAYGDYHDQQQDIDEGKLLGPLRKRRVIATSSNKRVKRIVKNAIIAAPHVISTVASIEVIQTSIAEKEMMWPFMLICLANIVQNATRNKKFGKAGDIVTRVSYVTIQAVAAACCYSMLQEAIGSKDPKQIALISLCGMAFICGAANEGMHIKEQIKQRINVNPKDNKTRALSASLATIAMAATASIGIHEMFDNAQHGHLNSIQACLYVALLYATTSTIKQNFNNLKELNTRIKARHSTLQQ